MSEDKRLPQDLVDFIEMFVRGRDFQEAKALLLSDTPPSDPAALKKEVAKSKSYNTSMLCSIAYQHGCGLIHALEEYQRQKLSRL